MPKRISKAKRPRDVNQLAKAIVDEATTEQPLTKKTISAVMSKLGRKGGKIGGKRRLETMTPDQRSQIALRAAQARWAKKNKKLS